MSDAIAEFPRDSLAVHVLADRETLGRAAAGYAAARLRGLLARRDRARVIFAAAPSQGEMLADLAAADGIDWSRVEAFQLDEYLGLATDDPRTFGEWLDAHIWARVRPGRIERIDSSATADPDAEATRYSALIEDGGIDLALVGVGENGHVAFNDPHVADFNDPLAVKRVEIDGVARMQQVHDGTFARVDEVPQGALTVTMSTIRAASVVSIVVPGEQKAKAIAAMLDGPISTDCPASILRRHPDAQLFLDAASAATVKN